MSLMRMNHPDRDVSVVSGEERPERTVSIPLFLLSQASKLAISLKGSRADLRRDFGHDALLSPFR